MNCSSTTFGAVSEKKFCLNPAGVVAQRIRAFLFYSVGELLTFPDKGQILLNLYRWDLTDSNPVKSQSYTIRIPHVTDNGRVIMNLIFFKGVRGLDSFLPDLRPTVCLCSR